MRCTTCRDTGWQFLPSDEPMKVSERRGLSSLHVVHRDGTVEPDLGGPCLPGDEIADERTRCPDCSRS